MRGAYSEESIQLSLAAPAHQLVQHLAHLQQMELLLLEDVC